MIEPAPLDAYTTTRLSWQALGEHILSAARHAANGRIGLRCAEGGVGTPVFASEQGDRRIVISADELIVIDDEGERRQPITTLRAAGAFAGIEPGAPTDVYTPSTALHLDAPLSIDLGAADRLARFYAMLDEALAQLRDEHAADDPAETQLWPEHFDLATTITEVNIGGSPGDADHDAPYLYVGPWAPRDSAAGDDFWNESWGASVTADDYTSVASALDFFRLGLERAAADPPSP